MKQDRSEKSAVKIIQKVLVKQIVTENSKGKLKDSFEARQMRLEQECQQLLFEQRKLQNKTGVSKQEIAGRFQQEIQNRKNQIQLIDFKLEQLELLEIGSEIIEKEVEALVEVEVGMHWDGRMANKAIIIKDDTVIRIE
ncbi:YlqD family protein [Ornithinibacillus gellani]|uniref:YlqD family protein n=1 Tax=Ornithinibacillus gellani TaxID=2293253 RepID=UPI001CC1F14A|nr:YlqD family protein [Ornithinibacillus gellani]